MPTLILLRHGQSQWNLEDRFTGWVDVDLTAEGEAEARKGGELIAAEGLSIDRCFTSVLTRAIRTSWLALAAAGQTFVPEVKDWRLNERHYGGLTGLNKTETAAKHGADQVKVWRRSYDVPPPPPPGASSILQGPPLRGRPSRHRVWKPPFGSSPIGVQSSCLGRRDPADRGPRNSRHRQAAVRSPERGGQRGDPNRIHWIELDASEAHLGAVPDQHGRNLAGG